MSLLVKDREFYQKFFSMTVVIALQNVITFSVNLADNVMIGGYSQDALSGIAMVNQIQFLLQMIITGICNGIVVMSAQYWGKRQIGPIRRIAAIGLVLGISVSGLLTVLTFFFPHHVLALLTDEQVVIREGTKYLRIICFSYMLFAITNIMLASLRSVETVRIGFVVTLSALFVNVFLNYSMIYGRFGFPEMGIRGAAIATLLSRIVEFSIVMTYALKIDRKICWKPSYLLHIDGVLFRDYLHSGLPLALSSTIWGIATSVHTAILGRLGGDAIAANSIATTLFQVVSVMAHSSAAASSVLIGKTVGEGDPDRVKAYAKTMQLIYVLIGLFNGTVLWSVRGFVLSLYNITQATYALATQFIGVLSITVIGTSYQVPCLGGIVTGGGDTHFVLKNDLIFQWLIVIPASFLSAFLFHAPLWVTFFCLKSDQILKCFVAMVKVNRFRWIRVLTRDDVEA